jgi:hypothetical protein
MRLKAPALARSSPRAVQDGSTVHPEGRAATVIHIDDEGRWTPIGEGDLAAMIEQAEHGHPPAPLRAVLVGAMGLAARVLPRRVAGRLALDLTVAGLLATSALSGVGERRRGPEPARRG